MIYSSEADIVPLLRGIVQSLQPYARANEVHLTCAPSAHLPPVLYQPYLLSQSVIHLVCSMISLLPPKSRIRVEAVPDPAGKYLVIRIENTELNLIRVHELQACSGYNFTGQPLPGGTSYTLAISFQDAGSSPAESFRNGSSSASLPQFYREIQKRLTSHFTRTEKLLSTLEQSRPQEAAFMQKVNTLIRVNLENENLDTDMLCRAMCMSRTQLFRKMKSLVRQAPANYIRNIRLQRAKELLETSGMTVSEIAYSTGFRTINHFTKVFKIQYGIPPTVFRSKSQSATNE